MPLGGCVKRNPALREEVPDRFSPIWSATDETKKVTVLKSYNCCRESTFEH
jgi:hypothetical protein